MNKNSVLSLHVRPKYSVTDPVWVFTDERVGLIDEPFVGNVNTCLTAVVRKHCQSHQGGVIDSLGVIVTFSGSTALPGAMIRLERVTKTVKDKGEGHYYNWIDQPAGLNCWLCPALFKYFDRAPKVITAHVRAL